MRGSRPGNIRARRIPKVVAEQTRIEKGSEMELSVTEAALTIRPSAPTYRLDELLVQVTPENRHDEIDWGEPAGKELW